MKNKILIIDDEKMIREGLKKLLVLDDYEVLLGEDGIHGLEVLEKEQESIQVVILDVKMPRMDGMEVLQIIKKNYPGIEVIISTGHGAIETAIQALRFGAFDYTNKPIEYDELALIILRALDKQKVVKEKREAQMALRLSEEKYRTVVEQANDGIAIISQEIFEYVSPPLARILNYQVSELEGDLVVNNICPTNIPLFKDYVERGLTGKSEIVFLNGKKEKIYIELSSGCIEYRGQEAYLVMFRDITERKQSEEKIRYLSFHDALTGLYNRAYFEEEMQRLDTKRQLPISIIMGDVNGLKLSNDAFGHYTGDELLKAAAECIKKSCRKEDIISRWGGDEFVILLPTVTEKNVQRVCERILDECEKYDKLPFKISISLGEATKVDESQDLRDVLKAAEDKMYKNKLMSGKSIRNSIITSLKTTLYENSFETEEHSGRMVQLCKDFGELLGLPKSKIEELVVLAALHDIGKVAISDEILSKPGKLTSEEMEQVKKHCEIGYRIAKSCPEISHVAEGILSHHERWDGNGYPHKLKGEKIPYESRIISIIDSYDVMISDRPYKNRMNQEDAIKELKRCAGAQFDAYLVDKFIFLLNQ
ncbi:diguanylate cyclase domain-containing protein [uncultured Ilyobacter sp.]|uniref:diguanylate cyclase domain-containing protein n=1 Tax=uncultured Ilyobacter sp. TaxID=544433 RepID=UPI0029C653EB|nr:HD domain-containing phosphohydrolase [uncultured Ilyobacter sp.]